MENFQIDRTDEEREELVKQWIKDYWLMVVIAILLAVALVFGINYFKKSKIESLSNLAVQNKHIGLLLKKNDISSAKSKVDDLQANNPNSSFSSIATLSLAQKHFVNKDYESAIGQYNWLISTSSDLAMRNIARLRKARAQANANKVKAAIKTLDEVEGVAVVGESYLLKGDIFLENKQFVDAKKAYEKILKIRGVNQYLINQRLEIVKIQQQIQ